MKATVTRAHISPRKKKRTRKAAPRRRPVSRLQDPSARQRSEIPEMVDVEFNVLGHPTVLQLDPRQFAPNVTKLLEDFERRHNSLLMSLERRVAHLENRTSAGPERLDITEVLTQLRERLS